MNKENIFYKLDCESRVKFKVIEGSVSIIKFMDYTLFDEFIREFDDEEVYIKVKFTRYTINKAFKKDIFDSFKTNLNKLSKINFYFDYFEDSFDLISEKFQLIEILNETEKFIEIKLNQIVHAAIVNDLKSYNSKYYEALYSFKSLHTELLFVKLNEYLNKNKPLEFTINNLTREIKMDPKVYYCNNKEKYIYKPIKEINKSGYMKVEVEEIKEKNKVKLIKFKVEKIENE